MDFTYEATITQEEGSYLIDFPAFGGGVFADGDTLPEACESASTTLRLAIAEYLDSGLPLPPSGDINTARAIFAVEVSDSFIAETKCLNYAEAAEFLNVSIGRISQMASEGQLEVYRHDGRKLITIASLNARKASQPKAGRPRKPR